MKKYKSENRFQNKFGSKQKQLPKVERQELHCHHCNQYVQFDIDLSLNGNHVLECPNCGHEHCRVVENGIITSERWDSRNSRIDISTSTVTYSGTSTWDIYNTTADSSTASTFLYQAWMNTAAIS